MVIFVPYTVTRGYKKPPGTRVSLLDSAKYSMNGTTIQSVSGDLSKVAQFQLRLT
eukprot:COSAG01_NODE_21231_length_911_cov_11.839901_2_plen_54_part_01